MARTTLSPATLPRVEFLRARIEQLDADQRAARKSRSWVAVRQLGQDLDRAHAELLREGQQTQSEERTPEEVFAELVALVRDQANGFPDPDVETLYLACCERLGIEPDAPANVVPLRSGG